MNTIDTLSPLRGWRLIALHLYPGIPIVLAYMALAPSAISWGFPALAAMLVAELVIMPCVELGHLAGWRVVAATARIRGQISFLERLSWPRLIGWSLAGWVACVILYAPMFATGLWLRTHLFSWLPNWFYDAGFDSASKAALITTFSVGLLVDGIIGPVVEEIYFRGHLLPRMAWMGNWAPLVHAVLFTIYHFWQPHNYPGIFMVSLVLSYAAWWKKSIWLSIGIHCLVNVSGTLIALLAAIGGVKPF